MQSFITSIKYRIKELQNKQFIENWKSCVSLTYFGVPGPRSRLNILGSRIPGYVLGVPGPLSYLDILGSQDLDSGLPPVDVLCPGSHFSGMPHKVQRNYITKLLVSDSKNNRKKPNKE